MADYPISNVPRRVVYAASGTGPYAFTFEILAQTDIDVYKGDTLLTLTTDYTVTINANGTGTVTLVATAGTSNITIVGGRSVQRTTDFVTGGDFFANTLNDELDSQTIFIQQIAETAERGLKAPVTDPTDINMTLPTRTERAGKYLAFDEDGNPKPGDTAVEVAAVYAIRNEIVTVAGIDTEVVAVAGNAANVTTVATNIANVNATATNIANVNAVAGNATNINAVVANATNINTVAGISADVSAVAAVDSEVSAVATDILGPDTIGTVAGGLTNINTVATNITNVNTVAGISANVTTVAGIAADVTAVAADATDIGVVATNIASVNTVATDIANVNTVASVASDVSVVATNVADVTNFADVYQGGKAADPSLRNDGSALQAGDLYFDTVADAMKVYDGLAWGIAYVPSDGFLVSANNLSDLASVSTAQQNLSLEPGVDVQAYDVDTAKYDDATANFTGDLQIGGQSLSPQTGFRNRIINGDMRIDQRNAGASVTATDNGYSLDRWRSFSGAASKFTIQQQTAVVPVGFTTALKVTSSSAYTATAGQAFSVNQPIEGYNVADLNFGSANAATITFSFWVNSSLTGTFSGAVSNGAFNRSYPFTYTISAANTYEYKIVTITGDTSGTWLTTTGTGLVAYFDLGSGSNFRGTAGAWAASAYTGVTGATSVVGTSGATFYITGVSLVKGSTDLPFEFRSYGQELALCQRYYWRSVSGTLFNTFAVGVVDSSTSCSGVYAKLPVTMRVAPTCSYSNIRIYDGTAVPAVTTLAGGWSSTEVWSQGLGASGGGLTIGRIATIQANNSTTSYIDASSEL